MNINDGSKFLPNISISAGQEAQGIGYGAGANFPAQAPQERPADRAFITISIVHYYGSGERDETRVERQFDGIPDRSDLEAACEDAILGIGYR